MKILGCPKLAILNRLFVAIALLVLTGATCMAQSESENIEGLDGTGSEAVNRRSAED